MIVVQRAATGAEPAVGQFVDALQLAINDPGQLERIQTTLELHQLRQPGGLGIPGARHALQRGLRGIINAPQLRPDARLFHHLHRGQKEVQQPAQLLAI